jgi:SSS family solute:Na+ symporter
MGGIRGVILTDLIQFALSVFGAVVLAVFAVEYVGGLPELVHKIGTVYPRGEKLLQFRPSFGETALPFQVFLIYVGIQWWAKYWSDGSGYLAQRMNTAKNPVEAEKGALWFTLANFGIRTWPWVLVGLAALVIFPHGAETRFFDVGGQVAKDREMAYPILMGLLLPVGLLGIVFVSMLAAFMSTVDTHINWAASYLTRDLYTRFVRRQASKREEVVAARTGVVTITVVSIIIASQIGSIEKAWKFFIAIASGLGLPQLLRWIWWRANAWTEIIGMSTAFICSLVLYIAFPDTRADYLLFYIVGISVTAALIGTFSTRPTPRSQLKIFCEAVQPFGFWGDLRRPERAQSRFAERVIAWVVAVMCVFSWMFGIGALLLQRFVLGVFLLALGGGSLYLLLRRYRKLDPTAI